MKRNQNYERGSFVVFFVLSLTALLAISALVIDGARLMISVTKNKQLAEQAATFAIREYVTYIPENSQNLNDEQIHNAKMVYVKKAVASLLNDELNTIFGNQAADRVIVDSEGLPTEGLTLTPGEYFPEAASMSAGALKTACETAEGSTKRLGCWVQYSATGNNNVKGNLVGSGVNSFYAVVKTPGASAIQSMFFRVVGAQKFQSRDEAYSFLKPRYFVNAVDLSESTTEETHNSGGRFRSKFMFKLDSGGGDCISAWNATSPACSFAALRDDQTWNGEFYSNPININDGRCTGGGSQCGVLSDTALPNGSCDALNLPMGSDRWKGILWDQYHDYRWESFYYQRSFSMSYPTGSIHPFAMVPACSPIYWAEDPITNGQISNTEDCLGRHTCFTNKGFSPYGYRFMGDHRDIDGGLHMEPLGTNRVARQPHFIRYKDDYAQISLSGLSRAFINDTTGAIESRADGEASLNGSYFYEDPANLRQQGHRDRSIQLETGLTHDLNNEPLPPSEKPDDFFQHDTVFLAQNYSTGLSGNGKAFPAGNRWGRSKGYHLPRIQPEYEGPEPYNSILKGLWYMHKIIAEQKVPGDKFGAFFFDSTLLAEKAQIPLTKPIYGNSDTVTVGSDQQKLQDLLKAINPVPSVGNFWDTSQISKRLNLGLFPDPLAADTNISHALSLIYLYLKGAQNFKGADTYLLLYSDFVAFAHCNLKITGNTITDAEIEACAELGGTNKNDTNKHVVLATPRSIPTVNPTIYPDVSPGIPDPYYGGSWEPTRQFLGMLNDLIGWPTTDDVGWSMSTNYTRKEGLIDFLSRQGINSIFFNFNSSHGGELIYPSPTANGCISRTDLKDLKTSAGIPAPTVRTRYGSTNDYELHRSLIEYRAQGNNGVFYSYVLGDLANPLTKVGGRLVTLLPPCPHLTTSRSQQVYPAGSGDMTAQARLDAMCNKSPNKGKTGNGLPLPLDLRAADADGNFYSGFWHGHPNWRSWGNWRNQNGWSGNHIARLGGATMINPIKDYGESANWSHSTDVSYSGQPGASCPLLQGYGFSLESRSYNQYFITQFTEPLPTHISGLGGLRCDPRTDPLNPSKPYGIDKQIEETVKDIIRQPKTLIVSQPNILTSSRETGK